MGRGRDQFGVCVVPRHHLIQGFQAPNPAQHNEHTFVRFVAGEAFNPSLVCHSLCVCRSRVEVVLLLIPLAVTDDILLSREGSTTERELLHFQLQPLIFRRQRLFCPDILHPHPITDTTITMPSGGGISSASIYHGMALYKQVFLHSCHTQPRHRMCYFFKNPAIALLCGFVSNIPVMLCRMQNSARV